MGSTLKRYTKGISILAVINLLVAGIICWISNKRNLQAYSSVLLWTSTAVLAIGGLSLVGSFKVRNNMGYQKARTIGTQNQMQRINEDLDSTEKSSKFVIVAGIAGAIGFGISALALVL